MPQGLHRFTEHGRLDGATDGVAEVVAYLSSILPKLEAPASAEEWQARTARMRREMLALLMAGHPDGLLDAPPAVEWQDAIETGEGYRIRKLRYEGYPGLWAPALLYEPLDGTALPAVLNAEGHHPAGNAVQLKQQRCINLAKRGIINLSYEFLGMGQLGVANGHGRLSQLCACGVSGVGIFYLIMKRALDILLGLPRVDASRVAMTGCSGGGWQTILLSSLDTRITAAVPVAGHSPVWQRIFFPPDIGDQEQTPPDFCRVADYDVLTAMMAPRPCLLIYNHYDDCCFQSERTVESIYQQAQPVYDLLGCPDNLQFHDCLFPRSHNYDQGNREQFYRFLERIWALPPSGPDQPVDGEILSEGEVALGLPDDNASLLTLAQQAAVRCRPARRAARALPLEARRARLAELLRLPALSVDTLTFGESATVAEYMVRHGLATIGPWTVPVLEIAGPDAGETALVLHDRGRLADKAGAFIDIALLQSRRVLAVDLWGFGQRQTNHLYPMVLEAAGERPLGLQVAQLLAMRRHIGTPCHLLASTLTAPVVAQAAAALEPTAWATLTTFGLVPSLDRIVDWPIDYADCPALFCPGLLAEFDIEDLLALSAPVPVRDETRGLLRPQRLSTGEGICQT
jgi:hypothetical protein